MKKTFILTALALATSFAYAQKPAAGDKTAEINLNFILGVLPVNFSLPRPTDTAFASVPGELRFRYFLSDKGAVRVRIGFGSSSTTTNIFDITQKNTAEVKNSSGFGLMLAPGYEMHFEGTEKLSPYVGGELGFLMAGARTTDVSNASVANPNAGNVAVGDKYNRKMGSSTGIRLGIFMGADYYFTESVYVGGEFGLGLFNMVSTGEGSITTKIGTGAETTTKIEKSSSFDLFGTTMSGIRLGIKF